MNDDLINKLKYISNNPLINGEYDEENYLFDDEAKLLLDYITNLQEENEEWSMIFDTFSKRPYAHKYLEEKKKELGNKKIIGLDSEMIYKDYYDYKQRNEKAIEYIKDSNILAIYKLDYFIKDLINILQGEDKK